LCYFETLFSLILRHLFYKAIKISQLKQTVIMFHLLDIIGTIAFTMSGALTAMIKNWTFWVFIIAFVTAVGGGTLRGM
jgi:hypothetical protein